MKKMLIFASFVCLMAFFAISCGEKKDDKPMDTDTTQVVQQDTAMQKPAEEPKDEFPGWTKMEAPLEGAVVCFHHMMKGADAGKPEEFQKCAEMGEMFGVKAGEKVYIVYNKDMSIANKQLAAFASAKAVTIKGYTKNLNGMDIIIAEEINPVQ